MNNAYGLIKALTADSNTNEMQSIEFIKKLDNFQFESNCLSISVSQLMKHARGTEDFDHSSEILSDLGFLFSTLAELQLLCEEQREYLQELQISKANKLPPSQSIEPIFKGTDPIRQDY